ncbi:vascular endothelial growth factor receptor 1-like [Parus major]|uniref:vascular endothelial growth factor receptor 1-like n=1 Tax=Parus major TaxID=9157 RepID=UPI0007711440|nr:vascular endothelial growth factor receptor 1-like [Parus major]
MLPRPRALLAVCALQGLLLLHGLAEEKLLQKPKLSIFKDQIVISPGDTLKIKCWGAPSVSWQLREDNPRVHVSGCRDISGLSCSQLVLRRATANDTGYLSCALNSTPEHQGAVARIYVFVQGKNFAF